MVLERSDSAESLSVYLARLAEHFRLATVSVRANQTASVFRSVLPANRLAFRQASPWAKQPGVPEGFPPSRFGGTGFFPAANWAKHAGVTFAFGEPAPGFTKLGGVFCPATGVGEPVATGEPLRQEIREPVPCCQSEVSQEAPVSVDLSAEDFVQRWSF